MPKEIHPSSFLCDCGHQLDFFENTVSEVKRASLKKRQWLRETCQDRSKEHIVVFEHGEMTEILCTRDAKREKPEYTVLQGRYLAFMLQYIRLHGVPPAEADLQRHFDVSPPSVHQMVLTLEKKGFIRRTPGQARSIKILISPEKLPRPA